jgi:hypothetical protein
MRTLAIYFILISSLILSCQNSKNFAYDKAMDSLAYVIINKTLNENIEFKTTNSFTRKLFNGYVDTKLSGHLSDTSLRQYLGDRDTFLTKSDSMCILMRFKKSAGLILDTNRIVTKKRIRFVTAKTTLNDTILSMNYPLFSCGKRYALIFVSKQPCKIEKFSSLMYVYERDSSEWKLISFMTIK